MQTAYALVSLKRRFIGGALYRTREEAERSLGDMIGTSYDGVIELTYEEPWPGEPTSKSDVSACDHTEGPWQSRHDFDMDGFVEIIGGIDGPDDGRFTYTVVCELNPDAPDFTGNRSLIIAAPKLLKALKEIASHDLFALSGPGRTVAEAMQRAAKSAIAEARA